MSELAKYLRTIRSCSAADRETRRLAAPDILREAGVEFTEHNEGAHLRVVVSGTKVTDFWPGTDTWRKLGGGRRSGIDKLIEYIRKFKEVEDGRSE